MTDMHGPALQAAIDAHWQLARSGQATIDTKPDAMRRAIAAFLRAERVRILAKMEGKPWPSDVPIADWCCAVANELEQP